MEKEQLPLQLHSHAGDTSGHRLLLTQCVIVMPQGSLFLQLLILEQSTVHICQQHLLSFEN